MKARIATIFIILLPALVQAETIVTLNDGSQLRGDVVSMSNGVYRIETSSMGMLEIPASRVKSITSGPGSAGATRQAPAPGADVSGTMDSLTTSIAQDPGLMATIMSLQTDPDMQAVLADPEVMQAVRSMDFEALARHPKIKALMENQKVQRITDSVQ